MSEHPPLMDEYLLMMGSLFLVCHIIQRNLYTAYSMYRITRKVGYIHVGIVDWSYPTCKICQEAYSFIMTPKCHVRMLCNFQIFTKKTEILKRNFPFNFRTMTKRQDVLTTRVDKKNTMLIRKVFETRMTTVYWINGKKVSYWKSITRYLPCDFSH